MIEISDIIIAIENKNHFVLDPFIRQGDFVKAANGHPLRYVGGFTAVFPFVINDEKWAFRCWHVEMGNEGKRFMTIADSISKANAKYLCDFAYSEDGIIVKGVKYPTTRMRWVDGQTIKEYICANAQDSIKLKTLAKRFLEMMQDMHKNHLAHGDLQHGNILVGKDEKLYLVDYDSFYCHALKGEKDIITGLPDYQHPARKNNKHASEKLDYFSELIIYLSIISIAKNPSLIDKYQVEGTERLLFSKEDFTDITNSNIYKDIQLLGKDFQDLLNILEEYLKHKDIDELLPFDTLLTLKKISFIASKTKIVRNTQKVNIIWDVPLETEIHLSDGNGKHLKQDKAKGKYTTTLSESTTFILSIKLPNGQDVKKEVFVDVFDESIINFTADKEYLFPSIPVKLSWKVKHAKKVWLDDEEVKSHGTKIIEPMNVTTCVLSAEDEFGKKEKEITIHMLPLPQVKTLLVPTPQIVNNISITVQQPKFNIDARFPKVDIDWIKTEIPQVPSLTELGLNVELSSPLPKSPSFPQIVINSIKRIFNQLTRE